MKEAKKSNSGVPTAIIVLVLGVMVAGGVWFYQTSKSSANKPATAANNSSAIANTQRTTLDMAGAPPGAQPPNALGPQTATVTIEEFADFQCGSCAAAHPVLKEITGAYANNKNFRFVFRNFPLAMHDKAYDAAVAAEAAGLQGATRFWQMQDQLFTNQHVWSVSSDHRGNFAEYAQKIGLDVEKFKADMSGTQAKQRVDMDKVRGNGLKISSTPTVIVNGKIVPFSEVTSAGLRRIIDAELQEASSAPIAPANTTNAK
ncbi:MAG: DsbA family protein [Pyrinomonadaceae bacterium]